MNMGLFVTGTDTGVGKTHVSCALLHALRATGKKVCGMKPVASGCADGPEGLCSADALALIAAGSAPVTYTQVNPVALRPGWSPHLAAIHDGVTITLPSLRDAFDTLNVGHDAVVVEGVGGWRVPLAPGLFVSQIARTWQLPVILVVGLRLGCLNHALLSTEAILADGCHLAGWIGNRVDQVMDAVNENIATLRELLPVPCLGVLPYGLAPVHAAGMLDLTMLPDWKGATADDRLETGSTGKTVRSG